MVDSRYQITSSSLSVSMQTAVPLWILKYKEKSGPSEEDFQRIRGVSALLAAEGDNLLFRSKKEGRKEGRTAFIFNKTAETIAVLSFLPGGISVFGQRWDSSPKPEVKIVKEPEQVMVRIKGLQP